jgi:pyruvate dehydrogenase complex dehydrogenase (E1) component
MIHNANHLRQNEDGLKVGGHQASSASIVSIMTALYFDILRPEDRVAVKPHASPVFHAIQYLSGFKLKKIFKTLEVLVVPSHILLEQKILMMLTFQLVRLVLV